MSQQTPYAVFRNADAPKTGDEVSERIGLMLLAALSGHSGAARPSYAVAGTYWWNTTNSKPYFYDGAADREVLAGADAAAMRTALGLVIGANVQAYDAELAALAGLVSAADRLPYFTGLGAAALATFTAFGRSLVDDADASAARATLGLGTLATQEPGSVEITGGSVTGITDLAIADGGTGASTAAAARTNLGLAIGTDVQAFNANLSALAGLTGSASKLAYFTGAGAMALADLSAFGRSLVDDADAATARATLGLGTAAVATLTTSTTDRTAGRVLKVGDGGIGGAIILTGTTALHERNLPPGNYSYPAPSVPGGPESAGWTHSLLVLESGTGATPSKLLISARVTSTTSVVNSRAWIGWHAANSTDPILWFPLPVAGAMVAAVSQSSGVPTGGVFETASNANGFYERRADGVLECWTTLTASASAGVTWTFPAAFSAAPVVTGTAVATVLSAVCLDAAPGTTSATLSARDKTDARRADTIHVKATGRWF